MEDWKEYRLDELYVFGNGLSKGSKYFGYGHPFVSFKTVFNNYFLPEELSDYVDSDEKEQTKCSVQKSDVLLTRTSETVNELGYSCVALRDYPKATFNGFCKRMRPITEGIIHDLYAGYYFRSSHFRNQVCSMSNMVTRASLSNEMLGRLTIKLPSYKTQTQIGELLFSIDRKIALNRQINDNLEQQIQALYQAWFIDLVPFNGVRPNSWDYGLLSDLLTIQKETIKPHNVNGMPYLPIDAIPMRCLGINRFAPSEDALSSLQKFHSNDIVIGAMRVYFHRVIIAPCEGITRNTSFVLRPNMLNTLAYCLCLCNQKDTIDFAQATSKGTTMPYAVWEGGLANMPITIPDKNILNEFETLVMPLISSIRDSYLERIKLEQLRDSLLPKLMSGELKINKIDC